MKGIRTKFQILAIRKNARGFQETKRIEFSLDDPTESELKKLLEFEQLMNSISDIRIHVEQVPFTTRVGE